MISRLAIAAALALAAAPAVASSTYSLKCENPRGAYLVTWADGQKAAIINPDSTADRLSVIGQIDNEDLRAVVLATADPTVTEILHLEPEPKVEIFADGELVQTDLCV